MRNDLVQETRSVLIPLALIMPLRVEGLTLSKPPLMSRKSVETFLLSICRGLTSGMRVLHASNTESPAKYLHWWGLRRPDTRATQERRPFIILSRILQKDWRRTMTRKEEGVSYDGLRSLFRTIPSALFKQGGCKLGETREPRRPRMT